MVTRTFLRKALCPVLGGQARERRLSNAVTTADNPFIIFTEFQAASSPRGRIV